MLERSLAHDLAVLVAPLAAASLSAGASAAPTVDVHAASPVTTVGREQLENLPVARRVEDLLRTCPLQTIPTLSTTPQPQSPTANDINCVRPDDIQMIDVYQAHNFERTTFGYQPLRWNPLLAQHAQTYANQLAATGDLVHSPRDGRGIERENLSKGLPGWTPYQLTRIWFDEKRYFTPGLFPNVSTTGDWNRVGHYSQIIWPTTTDIGCGRSQGSGFSWLVCRYSPGGNKDGQPVGANSWVRARLIGGDYGGLARQPKPIACRWIDTKTGKPVRSGPILATKTGYADESGVRPGIEGGKREGISPDPSDPNHAYDPVSGRNFFFDAATCQWKDSKTGKPVQSGPMLATKTGYADQSGVRPGIEGGRREGIPPDPSDPNRAFDPVSGRNFAKVPIPPK